MDLAKTTARRDEAHSSLGIWCVLYILRYVVNVFEQLCLLMMTSWCGIPKSQYDLCPIPDSKVHGANMGPAWGQQDPGGPHVGHVNPAIWDIYLIHSAIGNHHGLRSTNGKQ